MTLKINPPQSLKKKQESHKFSNDKNVKHDKKTFTDGANKHLPLEQELNEDVNLGKIYPWNDSSVRGDVTKLFNIRLSEPDWLKLKYLSDKTGDSMHSICLDVLIPAIHRRLKKKI